MFFPQIQTTLNKGCLSMRQIRLLTTFEWTLLTLIGSLALSTMLIRESIFSIMPNCIEITLQLRSCVSAILGITVSIDSFDYNGIPVLYDFFSLHYYKYHYQLIRESIREEINLDQTYNVLSLTNYLFGLREQLRFGNYITDSRTQALGYGGNQVLMLSRSSTLVSVTEVSPRNSFSSVSVVLLPISTTVQRIISLLCSIVAPGRFPLS